MEQKHQAGARAAESRIGWREVKVFLLMVLVQFISYSNLTINYRAIAAGLTGWAMVTDALAAMISYFIVRHVVKTEGWATLFGLMVGGSLAAWFGIWLTEAWR